MSREPTITINGRPLTPSEAMAVRVAISSYHGEMADPTALGDDEHGRAMVAAYRRNLSAVLVMMLGTR